MRVGDVRLDRVSCVRDLTTVRIGRVTETERAAKALFRGGQPSNVGADEQCHADPAGPYGAYWAYWAYYRVGRVIVYVESHELNAEAFVRQVIRNLR